MEFTQTPMVYVENILGNSVYMKREDLLPFSFGGNKVRIAQEFFSDMKSKGCDCIIGYGNARSNLSRAIANMSIMEKVECHIISSADNDGSRINTGNSGIVQMCNAKFHFCEKNNVSETVESVLNDCKKRGMNPYYIYGDKYGKGNEIVPLEAYRKVYEEIKEQSEIQFDYIFLATGTGMTQGGLLLGRKSHDGQEKIVGISVAREKQQEEKVLKNMLDCYSQTRNVQYIDLDEIEICDDYLCGGYGKHNAELLITIKRMMRENGIPLDITYTGKAYYGMKQYIESNSLKNKNILFIHTGGTPLFFDNLQAMIDFGEKDGR